MVGWNLLFILVGLLLIGIAGEAYLRLTVPFSASSPVSTDFVPLSTRFVPGVGTLQKPNVERRFTNNLDYWTIQRANSLGFLDREPIDPAHAAESCHVTIIGDSFVEAVQVPLSEKVQIQLEELATTDNPELDVTVSAFGSSGTGQVSQLPFYDAYARHLFPDLLVLVFVVNDPIDNSTVSHSLLYGADPDTSSRVSAVMSSDGTVQLRLTNTDIPKPLSPPTLETPPSWATRVIRQATETSHLARWLQLKSPWLNAAPNTNREIVARANELMRRQEHAWMFDGWIPTSPADIDEMILDSESTVYREAWGITKFALEQFKRRADHYGTALMILATYTVGDEGAPMFDILNDIAESLDIPVVSQQKYIDQQGYSIGDARFRQDSHWTTTGHRLAAEAVWEHIQGKWNGECPSATPDLQVEVDWIKTGHNIHTPQGKVWSDVFPKDLNLYREAYDSVVAFPPTEKSDWNIHLYSDGVTYIRDRCTAKDVENHFFLHVMPKDVQGLPEDRREIGFQSTTFHISSRGAMFDGKCLASMDLPEYEIDRIHTGQFVRGFDSEEGIVWSVRYNFALPDIIDVVVELQRSRRKPVIRANFDVYIDDGQLIYVKESCGNDDRDPPFFLHVFPADEKDLPAGREESGFDNLGFELMQKGGVQDGKCFTAVDLPEYDIASIKTGQVTDGAETWRTHYNFALPEIIDTVHELQQSGREPVIRSNFDVYIDDNQLIYVKEACNADDRDTSFFLHAFPVDENDLDDDRREPGFNNLGFELTREGGEHGGGCFAAVDLPDYDIASIRTGQVTDGSETWRAHYNFTLPEIIDTVHELQQSSHNPDIRANFDVYIYNHQLIYAKSPCDANDRDTSFFLHVFPADENHLPDSRQEFGFDNLDFELTHKGGMHDGGCFAAVDLPVYEIDYIRTGQWVRGEGNVWEASIEFAE